MKIIIINVLVIFIYTPLIFNDVAPKLPPKITMQLSTQMSVCLAILNLTPKAWRTLFHLFTKNETSTTKTSMPPFTN